MQTRQCSAFVASEAYQQREDSEVMKECRKFQKNEVNEVLQSEIYQNLREITAQGMKNRNNATKSIMVVRRCGQVRLG